MPVYRDTALLHPEFRTACEGLAQNLIWAYETGRTKTYFEIFETFRDPLRQADMVTKGVSKAGPFESAHQFGLAADFVPFLNSAEAIALAQLTGERVWRGWNWHSSHDWQFLKERAAAFNLQVPLEWDKGHVQHPHWQKAYQAFKYTITIDDPR